MILIANFFSTFDVGSDFYLSGEYFKNEDYAWGGLTLVFIYLPATHTMAALMGPKVAGECSIEWGGVLATIGVIVLNMGFSVGSIGGSGIRYGYSFSRRCTCKS